AYVQDIRLSRMVHGRVVRPPQYGARLVNVDEAEARAMPGVIAVVRDGSFLGVVAEREEQAIKARSTLIRAARWSGGSELPDPALMARAVPGQPVRLQWMRDDEFAWEPYGSAMRSRAKASLDANGRVVDWVYEVWSNTHSTRPSAPGGDNNLLASWYVAEASK